ncbi:hypothetical protein WN51_14119 [Melipona quadrifasciata]|uniref:PiggyBac transposable element-derived protein domain-containing protein n=1 Tax=Melipona quadrifasciata TaxID=166423 RepID=A0A0M9A1S0_9HYME|nr:hypothetical protein WN51_14119 [Melipona quadrifasciata]
MSRPNERRWRCNCTGEQGESNLKRDTSRLKTDLTGIENGINIDEHKLYSALCNVVLTATSQAVSKNTDTQIVVQQIEQYSTNLPENTNSQQFLTSTQLRSIRKRNTRNPTRWPIGHQVTFNRARYEPPWQHVQNNCLFCLIAEKNPFATDEFVTPQKTLSFATIVDPHKSRPIRDTIFSCLFSHLTSSSWEVSNRISTFVKCRKERERRKKLLAHSIFHTTHATNIHQNFLRVIQQVLRDNSVSEILAPNSGNALRPVEKYKVSARRENRTPMSHFMFVRKLVKQLVGDFRDKDERLDGKLRILRHCEDVKSKDCSVCSNRKIKVGRRQTNYFCDTCTHRGEIKNGMKFLDSAEMNE